MDMTGEFVREVAHLATDAARPTEVMVGGRAYATGPVVDPRKPDPEPQPLALHTLSGVVDYVRSTLRGMDAAEFVAVHVRTPELVEVVSPLHGEFRARTAFARSSPWLPQHPFEVFVDAERFNVWLQSGFVATANRDEVLDVTSNIREEQVRDSRDSGLAQVVVARTGIARVAEVAVPNPVRLRPYRTFHEVEQPESLFVLRLKDGPTAALFGADGEAWRNEAVASIAKYLRDALPNVEILA